MLDLSAQDVTAILLSLKVAGAATLAALPVAALVAYALARWRFPGHAALNALVHLPLVAPPVVTGFALLLLFGRRGPRAWRPWRRACINARRDRNVRQSRCSMEVFRFLAAAAIVCLLSVSAGRAAETLTIVAASDLKFAMEEIVASFKASHSGGDVSVIYGSSGKFNTQIQQGAPFDIFFSADIGFAKALRAEGLAVAEPTLYAVGRIVLWSSTRDASKMNLKDLDDPKLAKIAIANPKHAPYGKRAEEALRAVGLWDKLQDKFVLGENIAQTAQYVQTGAADIGIIAQSLAVSRELASKGGYALIPDDLHSPLEQAYVITRQGGENPLAKTFARYMTSWDARRIMIRYGFALPGETALK